MKETRCILCGSNFYEVVYSFQNEDNDTTRLMEYKITQNTLKAPPARIVRCRNCNLIYVNPREDIDIIISAYQKMQDDGYIAEEKGRRESARIVLKRISKLTQAGKILDIGCATGFLLDEARKMGWKLYGIEISEWGCKFAREKLNLENVLQGELKADMFPHNYFDAIVMLDVVEHLIDPRSILDTIRRILKPNGVLCMSTPDVDSFLSRILKARWWGIQRAHLSYFSKETLKEMLSASGFKVIKSRSHARIFSVGYWCIRLSGYNNPICKAFTFLLEVLPKTSLMKLNLYDQIEVYAKKIKALRYIDDDERGENIQKRDMKVVVVLPAYNAAKTLALTLKDIPKDIVDDVILVDDKSKDNTVEVARGLGLKVFTHPQNKGYGANQKTCYAKALEMGAEIVVMVHPDYQYDPKIIPHLIEPIKEGKADAVFGSRMMKGGALEGGMPVWKHNANILLTAIENVILGTYLTEYHSGFRAYSAKYLKTVNFMANSDGFVFDTEIIIQGLLHYLKIDEIPIKTRYFDEASTIKLIPSTIYGISILITLFKFIIHKKTFFKFNQFK